MRFPEWLYKLLPGDAGTQQLGVIWREASSTQNSNDFSVDGFVVPNDKCLVLTNASVACVADAAIQSSRRRLMADPPLGTVRYNIIEDESDSPVNGRAVTNWQGEVVIPAGWKIKAQGGFTGAGAGNNITLELHGYLIPRGTFVFG